MPGVDVAAATSHFGADAKRETEHLKNKHRTLPRGKIHSEVKFNERQQLKSFSNQFSLSQQNIITEFFSMTGISVCPRRGMVGRNKGEGDKPFSASIECIAIPMF